MKQLWLKFKRHYLPKPLAYVAKFMLKILFKTCRIEVAGIDNLVEVSKSTGCLLMLWHNRIIITCELFQRYLPTFSYTAFLSNSRDGEPIAQLLKLYPGASAIRVSHNMRYQALQDLIATLKRNDKSTLHHSIALITPDGPKGPLYKIKPGIVMAAKATGVPILQLTWESTSFWQLKTWDKFRIPKPFSTITITITSPLLLPPDLSIPAAIEWLTEKTLPTQ